ncbi:hypothetical protein DFH09DRAFT_1117882 [Mycena vulgaris]|nr:hypothetical protein DFH09DRAFT_1117882 [Mycena vulgaris]
MPGHLASLSPQPKEAWYWQHETQSYWKGPRNDRVWVPSIDVPNDLEPPPNDEDDKAPPPSAIAQSGLVLTTTLGQNPVVALWSSISGGPVGAAAPAAPSLPAATESPRNLVRHLEPRTTDRAPVVERRPPPPGYEDRYGGYTGAYGATLRYREEQTRCYNGNFLSREGQAWVDDYRGQNQRAPEYNDRCSDAPHYPPRPDVRSKYSEMHAHQERARDQALRERALTSHPSTSTTTSGHNEKAPRIIINVDHAPLDANGHPVFPVHAIEDDESDYGDSEDDDEDGHHLKKYRAHEEARLADVARRPSGVMGPVPSLPPAPSGAGLWGNLQFSMVPEACNLIQWMIGGCPHTRAMFLHLIRFYGGNPHMASHHHRGLNPHVATN